MKGIEYRGVSSVDGPIVIVHRSENVFYGEIVAVRDRNGQKRTGRIIDISKEYAVVQVFMAMDQCDSELIALPTADSQMVLVDPFF